MEKQMVVIGAGVAGMSTCYYASKGPLIGFSKIHCFDDGNPIAPSRDRFKIVRVDYADKETMKRAMEFYTKWQTLPDFTKFSKKKARLVAYRSHKTYEQIVENRKEFGLGQRPILSSQEVWSRYKLRLPEDAIIVLEEDDLLVDLGECLKSMRRECETRGVQFIDAHVDKLKYDNSFSGVILDDSREIDYVGATVVVAPGPWSRSLLMRSGREGPKRMAECVQIFVFDIAVDVRHTHPIVSLLGTGELMPLEDGHAKLTWVWTYSRFEPANDSRTYLALQCLLDAIQWLQETVPDIEIVKVTKISSFADGMTEGENLLIAKDPLDPSTIIFHGLSYTNAKGLPDLGLELLLIISDGAELYPSHGWSPKRDPQRQSIQPSLRPRGTFEDLNKIAKEHPKVVKWKKDHPGWEEGEDILSHLDIITFN